MILLNARNRLQVFFINGFKAECDDSLEIKKEIGIRRATLKMKEMEK